MITVNYRLIGNSQLLKGTLINLDEGYMLVDFSGNQVNGGDVAFCEADCFSGMEGIRFI